MSYVNWDNAQHLEWCASRFVDYGRRNRCNCGEPKTTAWEIEERIRLARLDADMQGFRRGYEKGKRTARLLMTRELSALVEKAMQEEL